MTKYYLQLEESSLSTLNSAQQVIDLCESLVSQVLDNFIDCVSIKDSSLVDTIAEHKMLLQQCLKTLRSASDPGTSHPVKSNRFKIGYPAYEPLQVIAETFVVQDGVSIQRIRPLMLIALVSKLLHCSLGYIKKSCSHSPDRIILIDECYKVAQLIINNLVVITEKLFDRKFSDELVLPGFTIILCFELLNGKTDVLTFINVSNTKV